MSERERGGERGRKGVVSGRERGRKRKGGTAVE